MNALQAVTYMMARTGTKPAELARATGKSPQNINKLVKHEVSDMRVSNLAQIAGAMGYGLQLTDGKDVVELD